jgi:hypothetical protein
MLEIVEPDPCTVDTVKIASQDPVIGVATAFVTVCIVVAEPVVVLE